MYEAFYLHVDAYYEVLRLRMIKQRNDRAIAQYLRRMGRR